MNAGDVKLRAGFIPLADAAAMIVAVDKGFAAAEGLDIELVREVSWSNVRDKLNIGLFDAAHLLAPVAIASSLGIGHVKVPILAPFNLGLNGNAITVSPALHAALVDAAAGDLIDPMVSARALAPRRRRATQAGRRAAHLRHDLSVLDPQLPAPFLDGGRRRRSGRGYPPGRAAAALHGGQSRQPSGRCVLRRRALEFGRGRSRRRPHPAFRRRISCRARPRRFWRCAVAGREENPDVLRRLLRAHAAGRRLRRGRRQPRRGDGDARGAKSHRRRSPRSSGARSTAA